MELTLLVIRPSRPEQLAEFYKFDSSSAIHKKAPQIIDLQGLNFVEVARVLSNTLLAF